MTPKLPHIPPLHTSHLNGTISGDSQTNHPDSLTKVIYPIRRIKWLDTHECNTSSCSFVGQAAQNNSSRGANSTQENIVCSVHRESPILIQEKNGPCPLIALVNALMLIRARQIPLCGHSDSSDLHCVCHESICVSDKTLLSPLSPTFTVNNRQAHSYLSQLNRINTPDIKPKIILPTSKDSISPLYSCLIEREIISLQLLLEAVIDEFMWSLERHTSSKVHHPDTTELYNFLQKLHTGMNVNPLLVPSSSIPTTKSSPHIGSFELSREVELYSIFGIPLVHGWIPQANSHVWDAFQRYGPTYEKVQTSMFQRRETSLGASSSQNNRNSEKVDIDELAVNEFFRNYASQLTDIGILSLRENLESGEVVILFRNNHFATILCEPDFSRVHNNSQMDHDSPLSKRRLLMLVTDEGYADTTNNVVWESLEDVKGLAGEFLTGDLRESGNIVPSIAIPSRTVYHSEVPLSPSSPNDSIYMEEEKLANLARRSRESSQAEISTSQFRKLSISSSLTGRRRKSRGSDKPGERCVIS